MKLIVGLGNPGEKYKSNRHNVGYMVVDKLKTQKLIVKNCVVTKTNTFMNDSGSSVKHIVSQYPGTQVSDIYIIHDDLDLPLGSWKISHSKGPKDHGGINNIEQILGTNKFARIRVGVDNRKPESWVPGEKYVLENFLEDEIPTISKVVSEITQEIIKRTKSNEL